MAEPWNGVHTPFDRVPSLESNGKGAAATNRTIIASLVIFYLIYSLFAPNLPAETLTLPRLISLFSLHTLLDSSPTPPDRSASVALRLSLGTAHSLKLGIFLCTRIHRGHWPSVSAYPICREPSSSAFSRLRRSRILTDSVYKLPYPELPFPTAQSCPPETTTIKDPLILSMPTRAATPRRVTTSSRNSPTTLLKATSSLIRKGPHRHKWCTSSNLPGKRRIAGV
ncbi:hypothetical protein BDW72DRAFT_132372 [Aspergillus terricola var. indicus]